MFSLQAVTKSYDGLRAVDRVDLDICRGRTTVLIGPSGCGKSTLLRLMIGLLEPDEGRVCFDGQCLTLSDLRALRHRVGYVIQQGGLFPHMSARDNIALMARHLGWDEARIAPRIAELAELTRFPQTALDRFPGELSGGQNQRVGLMRALMLDPEVLLLDEPLGALDPMIRYELQEDLRRIFRTLGKSVVLVTHDLAEAAYLGECIVLLRDGRIVQQGSLAQMIDSPAEEFVARFIRAQRSLQGQGAAAT